MAYRTDEEIAAGLLRQFQLHGSGSPGGLQLQDLRTLLRCSFSTLKRVIRSRPAEFAMYNDNRNKKAYVMCLSAGVHSAGSSTTQETSGSSTGRFQCPTCNLTFQSEAAVCSHMAGSRHRVALLMEQLRKSGSISANQQGIYIGEPQEQQGLQVNVSKAVNMVVDNMGSSTHVMKRVYQMRPLPEVQVLLDLPLEGWKLHPGQQLQVPVEVQPKHVGILCSLIIFDFGSFLIARELRAECDSFNDPDLPDISAKTPYKRQKARLPSPAETNNFEPGEKEKRDKIPWQKPPRDHKVPNRLRQLVHQFKHDEVQKEIDQLKGKGDISSHLAKLHLLLHLEELQQEVDVNMYNMTGVTLEEGGSGKLLGLKVPGLAEARPSVMRGDALFVAPASADGSSQGREYQRFVYEVRQEEVLLRFSSDFHSKFVRGRKFNVRFSVKRTGFVFMHEALDVAQRGLVAAARPELLLPPANAQPVVGNGLKVTHWFNRNIGSNPEQQSAVQCVVAGSSGKLPYIIWGPPGTGKTSTLVEAAAQVLKLLPASRVLLVAPSNLAADLLAQRLLQAGRPRSEMMRVCAFSRPKADLPVELENVTCWDDSVGAFVLPQLHQVMAKRVVVVTALMAGKLHALGVPANHFSHIMMDEAGHAEEPLALCALAGLSGPSTFVVLAGDPKQLGPVIHSSMAGEGGLRLSLLERLASSPPYAAAETGAHAAAGLIVKLVRNYRSHPMLLDLPSRLFYGGELQACASSDITDTLLHWNNIKGKRMPVMFHSVKGKDEREENSPSWFNVLEAKLVLQYVQELLQSPELRRNRVNASQIAVITPYRKQVQKLRKLLDAKGFGAVRVGSVEQLQGQERRVIIISTVCSNPTYLDHDLKHRLGFVASPKRFNVAITRAQALMIVVGNAEVLAQDKHWRAFMLHCKRHGALAGPAMPDLSEADEDNSSSMVRNMTELQRLMAGMQLGGSGAAAAADDELESYSALVGEIGAGMVRHE